MTKSRSPLVIILITIFIDLIGFGIVIPVLPLYAERYGASETTVGILLATYSAMQFVFAPILGRLSDRVGRRPVLLLSLIGTSVGFFLMGLAPRMPGGLVIFAMAPTLTWLFVARIVDGISGGNISTAQAYIADVTPPEQRSRGMGLIGAAFGLGFIFGPAIGGLLAHYGHHAPGLAAFAICGLNLIAAYWRLPESLTPELKRRRTITHPLQHWRAALAAPHLATPLLLFAAVVFAFSTMETTLALLCATSFGLEPSQIYWLFGFMGIVTTVLQGGLIGRLARHVDEASLVLGGTV